MDVDSGRKFKNEVGGSFGGVVNIFGELNGMDNNTPATKLALVEQKVELMFHDLYGNGQPGQLHALREEIRALGKYRYILMGALAMFTFIVKHDSDILKFLFK